MKKNIFQSYYLKIQCMLSFITILNMGCASNQHYFTNRAADFMDIWNAELSVGPGAHGTIHVTDFLGTGLGYSQQRGIWLHGRYIGHGNRDSIGLAVWTFTYIPEHFVHHQPVAVNQSDYKPWNINGNNWDCEDHYYYSVIPIWSIYQDYQGHGELTHEDLTKDNRSSLFFVLPPDLVMARSFERFMEEYKKRILRSFDLSIGASMGIGLQACVSPGEFADFTFGWFGLDIAHDDYCGSKKNDYKRYKDKEEKRSNVHAYVTQ